MSPMITKMRSYSLKNSSSSFCSSLQDLKASSFKTVKKKSINYSKGSTRTWMESSVGKKFGRAWPLFTLRFSQNNSSGKWHPTCQLVPSGKHASRCLMLRTKTEMVNSNLTSLDSLHCLFLKPCKPWNLDHTVMIFQSSSRDLIKIVMEIYLGKRSGLVLHPSRNKLSTRISSGYLNPTWVSTTSRETSNRCL